MRLTLQASTEALLKVIADLELPLFMDDLTPGKGNCFFAAFCQQMRRPEVGLENLYTVTSLRCLICDYALTEIEERVVTFRNEYEKIAAKPWNIFFNEMRKNGVYAEGPVPFVAAYMLNRNIIHISLTCKSNNPWYLIKGERVGETNVAPIILGNISNVHFQSFLPTSGFETFLADTTTLPDQLRKLPT